MKGFINQFISEQFLRFLIAGGIAAAVNFAVGYSLSGMLPFHGDIIAGHLSGMIVAFFLFGRQVFEKTGATQFKEVAIFIAVNAVAMSQTYAVYFVLMHYVFPESMPVSLADIVARATAIITPIFTSFLGHKYFTFRTH